MLSTRLIAVALVAAVLPAAQAAAAPAERATLDASSFKDAAGDSGAAPDITDVDVGNDVVAGPIVFWITVPNRPDDLVGEETLVVLIDADRNPATGDEAGAEYWLGVTAEDAYLLQWNGTEHVDAAASSLRATFFRGDRSTRIAIHPTELGGVGAFDFYVVALSGEEYDIAPNGPPAWTYTLASGRPPLFVIRLALSPKAPAAGKLLTVTMPVGRGDTFDLLSQGKVTCTLVVGGKALKAARAGFLQGTPFCRWNLPRTAKGKTLKGSIALSFGGSTAKKSFTGRVR